MLGFPIYKCTEGSSEGSVHNDPCCLDTSVLASERAQTHQYSFRKLFPPRKQQAWSSVAQTQPRPDTYQRDGINS